MAQRRMFNKTITNDDNFIEMPPTTQNLYFHLNMNADDDGFVNNWKSIMRITGSKEDDLKILIAKQYIIPFDSGVIVIRHWRLNNYLQRDRITPTNYQEELAQLSLDNKNVYNLYTKCIHRLDKNRLDKISIDNNIVEKDSTVPYKEIINYLNEKASTNYRSTTRKTQDLIKARWNEHFTLDNFKKVIDNKCTEWIGTEMEKFIRPETLFGNKFESYLNQKTVSAVPKWFNEEIKEEDLAEEKVREMEKLMEDFK